MKFYEKKSTILMVVLLLLCIPVKAQLVGGTTYPINGTQNPPTSFGTVGNAFFYLDSLGTTGNGTITLEIASGYAGEGSTAIPALLAYPGMDASRPVLLKPASGQSPTISTSPGGNLSVIRFSGARYFTIDGSNNGSSSQNLTITTTATSTTVTLVGLTPTATSSCKFITVKNVKFRGNSTTSGVNTYAGIYLGSPTSTPGAALAYGNDSNLFQNNLIEAVRNGIYLRGTNGSGQYDNYNRMLNNTVGGTIGTGGTQNTTYFGGVSTSAGVYLNSQQGAIVQGNLIRNSVQAYYYARGIFLESLSATGAGNKNIVIDANRISGLIYSGSSGYGCHGIKVQVNSNTAMNVRITNNFISNIAADGDNPANVMDYSIFGIQLANYNTTNNSNVGIYIYHNSINLYNNGTQKLSSSYTNVAACIGIQQYVAGGVEIINNALQNTYPGSGASITSSRSMVYYVQNSTINPLIPANGGKCKNNDVYINAANVPNYVGFILNANQSTFANWKSNGVDSNSLNVDPEFQSPTDLHTLSYNLDNVGFPVGVTTDIDGNTRSLTTPDIGGTEYTPPAYNAAMLRIFNVVSGCNVGNKQIKVTIKNSAPNKIPVGDTIAFWYTVNGGAKKWDTAFISSNILTGDSLQFTFNTPYNFSSGSYTIYAGFKYSRDAYSPNDSTGPLTIQSFSCIATNPYVSDFESGDEGYTQAGGWVRGVINKTNIKAVPSGKNGWTVQSLTGQYINYQNAYLYSPLFDFSTACKPSITWKMRYLMETNYDAIVLEGTTDNVNWIRINTVNPAYNSTSTYGPVTPNKWTGDNGDWLTYQADLSAFANAPLFAFRFYFGSDVSNVDDGPAVDSIAVEFYPTVTNLNIFSDLQNDTGFVKAPYKFTSSINGKSGIKYYWYEDGAYKDSSSGIYNSSWPTAGSHTIKHIAKSCAQIDSVTIPVKIVTPVGLPTIDFIADKNNAGVGETIELTSLTGNGVFNWTWMVTPEVGFNYLSANFEPNYSYVAPSSQYTRNTDLYFFLGDKFDVCLIAENVNGIDTLCKPKYLDVYNSFNGCTYPTIPFPTGKIFDSGMKGGAYANNEACTAVIQPPCADSIFLKLNMLATEANGDFLRIYDGDNLTGKPLWDINKYPNGLSGSLASVVNLPATLVAASGYVTVMFNSNGSNVDQGYELEYWSTAATIKPTASFDAVDTLCPNADIMFTNTTTTQGNTAYYWDIDNDGIDDYTDKDIKIQYPTPGTYTVSLRAENCIGVSTFTKTIVIQSPTSKPRTAFSADITSPASGDIVTLFNETPGCMENYVWIISPGTYSFAKGTTGASLNPMISFNAPGCYDVTLITSNAAGTDTLKRICYINVKNVCTPFVSQLNTDIGISRVKLNTIDNSSDAGTQAYSNYTNVYGTTLKKGVVYALTMERATTINSMSRKAWIDYNYDGVFDASEVIAFESAATTKSLTAYFKVPRTINTGYTRLRVGASFSGSSPVPCGANFIGEFEDYRIVIANDDEKPVITLLGTNPMSIERGRPYIEPGATATDNADGNLTAKIIMTGSVDTLHVGTYTISYDVTDSAGNAAVTVKRVVNVTPDVTKPVVVLNGNASDTMVVYTSYSDPGATATDIVDGNLTSFINKTSTLDTAHTGTYTITYTVSDSSGNIGFVTRQVVVIDTTRPVITLISTSPLFWPVNVPYVDPGSTVTDNYDNGLTATVTGTVDEKTVGTYYITFNAVDNSGNIANTVIREVRVADTIKPVVSIIGPDVVTIDVFTSYFEFGSTAADNYDKTLPAVTVIGTVDTAVVGDYDLKYVITDSSGNTSDTVVRTVKVVDRVAPTITVHDPIIIERTQPKPNLADSVDYSDNYYPKSQLTLNIVENINVNIDGYYYIDYTVTDPSGNTSPVAKGLLIVTRITGVMPPVVNDAAVNLYPNPAVNKAYVSLNFIRETEAKVAVYSMTGQKVLEVQPQGSFTNKLVELNLENLSAGTYFVRVEGNDGIVNKKLVISK